MKVEIYQSLYTINNCLQIVSEELQKLKEAQIIPSAFAEIRSLAAYLMRAEINSRVTLNLHEAETKEASQLEQQKLAQEKQVS